MQLCGLIVRWIGEDKRDISLIITTKQQLSWTREERRSAPENRDKYANQSAGMVNSTQSNTHEHGAYQRFVLNAIAMGRMKSLHRHHQRTKSARDFLRMPMHRRHDLMLLLCDRILPCCFTCLNGRERRGGPVRGGERELIVARLGCWLLEVIVS
jgi:hypothetical protein